MASYNQQLKNKKSTTAAKYGLTVPAQGSLTEEQYYKRLAKIADQRLVRLEKLAASNQDYKNVLNYAYRDAVEALKDLGMSPNKAGQMRFNRATKNKNTLRGRINAATRFIEAVSSQKSAIDKMYKQKVDSINNTLGLSGNERLTWEDLSKIFDSKIWDELKVDSASIMKTVAKVNKWKTDLSDKSKKEMRKEIKNRLEHLKESDDIEDEIVNKIMTSKYGNQFY